MFQTQCPHSEGLGSWEQKIFRGQMDVHGHVACGEGRFPSPVVKFRIEGGEQETGHPFSEPCTGSKIKASKKEAFILEMEEAYRGAEWGTGKWREKRLRPGMRGTFRRGR